MNLLSTLLLASFLPQVVAKASEVAVEVDATGTYHTKIARKEPLHQSAAVKVVVDPHGSLIEEDTDDEKTSTKETMNKTLAKHQQNASDVETAGDNDPELDELQAMMLADSVKKSEDEPESMVERVIPSWFRRRKAAPAPLAIDCRWADWEEERPCSQTCGGGMLPKTRRREVKEQHGGRECQGKDWKIDTCKNDPCPTLAPTTPAPTTTPWMGKCATQGMSIMLFACLWMAASFNSQ